MFYMLLLEQNTTRRGQVSKKVLEWDISNKNIKEYKVEAI